MAADTTYGKPGGKNPEQGRARGVFYGHPGFAKNRNLNDVIGQYLAAISVDDVPYRAGNTLAGPAIVFQTLPDLSAPEKTARFASKPMSELESTVAAGSTPDSPSDSLGRLARRFVTARLDQLKYGRLVLIDGEQVVAGARGISGTSDELTATVRILDQRFYSSVAFGGAIGAAEAYMDGYWDADNLTKVVRILLQNRDALEGLDHGAARMLRPLRRLLHWTRRNSRSGSRRNIASHYDLGNRFFGLWLDKTMMYSAAVFEHAGMNLEEASEAKLRRICEKLELSADDHVLEIGTGWGGFAIYAARQYGCTVTTTTISREQYEHASKRVSNAGLGDRINLLLEDYRDLTGEYDKIVSIEMVEAVGERYLDDYVSRCSQLLKPDGMMLLQAITIADQRYEQALRSVDFIQRYIFPGGFLPSVTRILSATTQSSDLRLYHLEDIGPHYALTLQHWRERFHAALDSIKRMNFDERFLRMWHYYFCYCEGAFIEQAIGNVQMLLVKPGCRRQPIVPALKKQPG